MRFLFCDRILKIEKGKRIEGVKAFSVSEAFLQDHFSKRPLVPGVIYMETMAQTLGWLIAYSHDFVVHPIISILEGVKMAADLGPGFKAHILGEIISTSKTDSIGRGEMRVEGKPIAAIDRMIYSHFLSPDPASLSKAFASLKQTAP